MKRQIVILIAATCMVSLTACGSKKPETEKVLQAIEEGTLTLEDAVDKGYVTQEWADDYVDQKSIPAGSKTEAGLIGDFTTTTLAGEEFTKENLGSVTFFVFLDPSDENAESLFKNLSEVYADAQAQGAEITVCLETEENKNLFENAPFPVILYNDSLKEAVKSHSDMIEEIPNSASWYVNGSFLSAWYSSIDTADFADTAAAFVEMSEDITSKKEDSSGSAAMAVMG